MSHRFVLIIAVLTFCGVFRTHASEIEIRGRVVDGDGAALTGAAIELLPWLGSFDTGVRRLEEPPGAIEPLVAGRSDSWGFFELPAAVGGNFRLRVEAAGRMPMEIRLAHLIDDVELRTLELVPASKLKMRVVSGTGKSLADAMVKVTSRYRPDGDWYPAARRARTGAGGTVTVKLSASNRDQVAAFVPGLVPAREQRPSPGAITLELATGAARAIEVRDAAGRPVAGALVRVGGDAWPVGMSGEGGRFVVHPPVDGDLHVAALTVDGRDGSRRVPAPKADDVTPVTIELKPLATVSGRVSDALTGRPLAGARVWLPADPTRFVESARDGSYSLAYPTLRRRSTQPRAAASGYLRTVESSRFGSAGATRDLALQPAVPLSGRVVDGLGDVIEDAEVTAKSSAGGGAGRSPGGGRGEHATRSRSDGGFRLGVARDVVYQLDVSKPGFVTARMEAAAGDSSKQLEVVLQPGRWGAGRVVDIGDSPVPGAEVRLSAPAPPSRAYPTEPGELRHWITTDSEGRFEVGNLAPGKLDLKVTAPGYASTEVRGVDIVPGDDGTVDLGTVVLEPGVRLEGRVVDPDGQPLTAAKIQWMPWSAGNIRGFSGDPNLPGVTSSANGRFVIEDLARGAKFTLEARLKGFSEAQVVGVEAANREPVVLVLEPKATIRGLVVDNLGAPVPEAMVMIYHMRAGGGSRGTGRRCDADGRFEVEVDAKGRVRLSASSAELRSTDRFLEIAPGQLIDDMRLVLEPGAVVEGQVLGLAGEPVAGASIVVFGPSLRTHSQVAGDDGEFRLGSLEVGPLTLHVSAEGYPQTDQEIDVRPGTNTVEIRMRQSHEVHGRVVDEALEPVGGAQVMLSGRNDYGETVSDAEGGFVVEVPAGTYRLQAGKPGFFAWANLDEEIEVAGAPVFGLEIRLIVGGAITGRVLGLDSERLAAVSVSTRPGSGTSTVDHKGRYRIEHLPPREWVVEATVPGSGQSARGRTVLAPGDQEAVLDLEFTAGLTLAGRVTIDGQPEPGVQILVFDLDRPAAGNRRRFGSRHATTDYRGGFHIADLEPGRYRLEVRQDSIVRHLEVDLVTDQELEIELRSHELSGRVLDAATGEPLELAAVALEPTGGATSGVGWPRFQTDARGFFRFARVAEGGYRLRVTLQGYGSLVQPLEVAEGAELQGLDLRLDRTAGLTLKVRSAAGGEQRVVWVAALGAAGEVVFNRGFEVTEGGNVHLSSLPAGRWLLIVAAPRAGTIQLVVDAPGDPVPVLLPPDTVLDVRVPELAGGTELATVTVSGADGRLFQELGANSPQPIRQWTVQDGRATVTGLPPGQWNVEVTAAGGRSWNVPVVAGGGRMQVEIE